MHHGTSARGSSYYDWRRMTYYAYIMASRKNGTLYVGVKIDVIRRAFEHREGTIDGFTERYDIKSLVYFEEFDDPRTAIQREKNINGVANGSSRLSRRKTRTGKTRSIRSQSDPLGSLGA
jgi:putative endonuclease